MILGVEKDEVEFGIDPGWGRCKCLVLLNWSFAGRSSGHAAASLAT